MNITKRFCQKPSNPDLDNAKINKTKRGMVVSKNDKKVYFYSEKTKDNGCDYDASIDLEKFYDLKVDD